MTHSRVTAAFSARSSRHRCPPAAARAIPPDASSSAISPSRRSSPSHDPSSHRPGPATALAARSRSGPSPWPAETADGTATGMAKYADNGAPAENVLIRHHTSYQELRSVSPAFTAPVPQRDQTEAHRQKTGHQPSTQPK